MADEEDERSSQRSIQSVEVGGRLLLALAEWPGPMALKDLAKRADLTPSRAHPYLVSFARLGFVVQDPVSGKYAPGPAAFRLGLSCLHQSDAISAAGPIAQALAERIGHAVAIAVWANFGPTVVRMFEGSQPLHVNMRAGSVMALFGTATGEAFAATLPAREVERAAAVPHGGAGPKHRGAPAELMGTLERVRQEFSRHGLTRAIGRPIPGVNAFSAPVRDHEGRTALVLTALGPEEDFSADWNSPIARAVKTAAQEVSARLGHDPIHSSVN